MKNICRLIKIKPHKLNEVYEWAKTLNEREDEVVQTLKDESVLSETAYLTTLNEEHYLVYTMRVKDEEQAKNASKTSTHNIDAYHQSFKESAWAERIPCELLIDFQLEN